jgi:endoplasmic reticulum junction formation protein lunapark
MLFVCFSYPCLFPVEQKDQKTLEKLRAERKAKIDELKERTNYYLTQQLIQVSGQIAITQST